jgi:hypothetical protein
MKKSLLFAFIITLSASCEEMNKNEELNCVIQVINTETWTPENTSADFESNATVKVYKTKNSDSDKPIFEKQTNENGEVEFELSPYEFYLFLVEKEFLSNIIDTEIKNNLTIGFLIDGIFQSQEEIDSSPQPNAIPGDPRLTDINADGLVDANDKVPGTTVYLTNDTIKLFVARNSK